MLRTSTYLPTTSLFFSLLLAAGASCAADYGEPEPSCEDGQCDGLSEFAVDLEYNGGPYYACGPLAASQDERCANLETDGLARLLGAKYTARAAVVEVDEEQNRIAMLAQDTRFLTGPNYSLEISDLDAGLIEGVTSRGGFALEVRATSPDAETDAGWQPVVPSDSFGGRAYWYEIDAEPDQGLVAGKAYICRGDFCEETGTASIGHFEPIGEDELVEYRVTFMPIYNLGRFDDGEYEIDFTVR